MRARRTSGWLSYVVEGMVIGTRTCSIVTSSLSRRLSIDEVKENKFPDHKEPSMLI